jgi:DNA-binding CsgD family transcriptional regulator
MRQTDPPRDQGTLDPSRRRLTLRETECVRLLASGLTVTAIAQRLAIRSQVVSSYLRRARWRLGITSRQDLIAWVVARASPDAQRERLRRV